MMVAFYLYGVRGDDVTADWSLPKTIKSRRDTLLNSGYDICYSRSNSCICEDNLTCCVAHMHCFKCSGPGDLPGLFLQKICLCDKRQAAYLDAYMN